MNGQVINVKHKHELGGNRTADRIEGHIEPASISATASIPLEEVLDSAAFAGKESRTAHLLATDKMVYCQAFFWRITLV